MPVVTSVLHHHIGFEGPFETGLNICTRSDSYIAQIDWLTQQYNVISLEQLLSKDIPKRALLLTFDDAFRSVLDVVRDVLAPRGLPSVFFINPGLLQPGAISLDSALAWAVQQRGLGSVCRHLGIPERDTVGAVVVGDMSGKSAAERYQIRDMLLTDFGPPVLKNRAPLLCADDLEELVSCGVEIGNHTMNHVHCRSLLPDEMQEEIVQAKARLEALSGSKVRSFSVPYGHEDDLTPSVLECLRSSGHEAIFLVHSRSNWRQPSPDIWYRTSLHDESPGQLRRELTIKPLMRTFKQLVVGR